MSLEHPAILALEDGTVFRGISIGAEGSTVGEVVFNTAMTGYQEILTDPSYSRQLVTLTYPHIGNTGVNDADRESARIMAAGLIIRDLPLAMSNWRSKETLDSYLRREGIVGLAGIDTRKLTRLLRSKGAQNGCIMAGEKVDEAEALRQAKAFPGLKGMDLAKVVSTTKAYAWKEASWKLETDSSPTVNGGRFHVVAYDYGVKHNILRILVDHGCRVTVVPAQMPAKEALALRPDGVFLANGPGDPEPCDYAIKAIREILTTGTPVFGICLGHQILGLALGGKTYKLKFGHHGGNHPIMNHQTGKVEITAQNHNFNVDPDSLPANVEKTHTNLNDQTLAGLKHKTDPMFSVQYHPEASPGPHDSHYLFKDFRKMMEEWKK